MSAVRIGLIGDRSDAVFAHRMIPIALDLAAREIGAAVDPHWVVTETTASSEPLAAFDGLWCVPASPYRSMDGALTAIRFAREHLVPFLGTCGGFQHAVIEYARNVLGWRDAEPAETAPDAARAVISQLSCALVEVGGNVRFRPGSKIANAYGRLDAIEGYHCSYGLNPKFQSALTAGPLTIAAEDDAGAVRAVELAAHPFFVATLFQPERGAQHGIAPPLVVAFLRAVQSAHAAATTIRDHAAHNA